jgi:hypothetical protein
MNVKKKIQLIIREEINQYYVDEERIPNPEADEYVEKKENFIGSHTYGENLGDLDKMYVAYSYGEQHPLFVWVDKEEFRELRPNDAMNMKEEVGLNEKEVHLFNDEIKHEKEDEDEDGLKEKKGPWFYNEKPYYVLDKKGRLKPNRWTKKHLHHLRPNEKVQARDTLYLKNLIKDFKKKYGLKKNKHTCLKPGEK